MPYRTSYPLTKNVDNKSKKQIKDNKTKYLFDKFAEKWLSQLNQPIKPLLGWKHLFHFSRIFPDTLRLSRTDTTFNMPINNNSSSPQQFLVSLPDFVFLYSFLLCQSGSAVISSQPTTPSLPFSTSNNSTTPIIFFRSIEVGQLTIIPHGWYRKQYFQAMKKNFVPFSFLRRFSF